MSLYQESGFRSKRFSLSLPTLLNRGHINTRAARNDYFRPFGQGNRGASLQRETRMESM